jgi:competence protein ComEA
MNPRELKTWQSIVLGFVLGATLVAALFFLSLPTKMTPLVILPTITPKPVFIHVSGAVMTPGTYFLAPNSRIQDAIISAGGPIENSDLGKVNLAAPVVDGQKINIPFIGEEQPKNSIVIDEGIVHLNSATAKDLDSLPGVGTEKAAAILAERDKRGRFQSMEDLLSIPGISKNLYEQILPFLMLD